METFIRTLVESLLGENGQMLQWFIALSAAVGMLRLFFKPIMECVEKIVSETITKRDDLVLEQLKGNAVYKSFVFLMDLILSVKIPVIKVAVKKND